MQTTPSIHRAIVVADLHGGFNALVCGFTVLIERVVRAWATISTAGQRLRRTACADTAAAASVWT